MKSNLDLLLVNVGGVRGKVYQILANEFSAIEPPFWAALTASFIRSRGYNVEILDANADNLGIEETAEIIVENNPNLINIVVYGQQPAASTQLMHGVNLLCSEIKKRNNKSAIILTGLHPSALPERTLREEECDFVGEGEGFHTLLRLLQKRELPQIPGLWYKEDGKISHNPRAQNIQDLDSELPDVAWDLLPWGKYKAHNWQCLDDLTSRDRYASLSTSLGCPFACTFCSIHATFGERKIRNWSPEWVLKQIDTLVKEYGVKIIKIIDELFVFKPEHFMPVCDGLIERDYGLNIWAYARVDTIKEEYLEKLRRAGFKWLCLGIESGSKEVRKSVLKGRFEQEDIFSVVRKIKDADINILGNYLFGLPEDDMDSMQETLDLAIELQTEYANLYCATAYPGSKLYEWAIAEGIKLPDSWIGYSQHSYEYLPLPTKKVSAAEVLRFKDKAFHTYFTNPAYLDMVKRRFGLEAREHIQRMTEIKLRRRLLGD